MSARARCVPLAEWPEADQRGWQAALATGDLLLDDGPGARLKPVTLRRHRQSYGRWLDWLQQQGRLDPANPPGTWATPETITGYVTELQARNAPQTVLVRLQSLAVVLGWLDPDDTRKSWLRRILARLQAMARPVRDKRARLRGADELLALGQKLMDSAEAGDGDLRQRAQRYRDGLMIATLACRPLRLRNLVGLEISRQLQRRDDGWWIEIGAQETKTGEPVSVPFPEILVPALEAYIERWRPRLASPGRVAASIALWLTEPGRGISPNHARLRISRHTKEAFGQPVNPHLFRDSAATTVAITRPEQVRIVGRLLGHRGIGTAQKHYNQARDTQAAQEWHRVLGEIAGDRPAPAF